MLKALIVDDEALARRGLELRLQKFSDIEICAESRNGREALLHIKEFKPDILFLDVQMPGLDGFDVVRLMSGSTMPATIFVTAYDEFAIRAFAANAIDYLLKPINDDRLAEAVERVRINSRERNAEAQRSKLLKLVCELTGEELSLETALMVAKKGVQTFPKRLAIRDGSKTACIDVESIEWIDAAGDYMCVHSGEQTHILRGTMKHLEELLNPDIFVRVHRSAIVNRHHVASMRPHRNGEYFLTLANKTELKLSRKYKSNLDRIAHRSPR